MTTPLQRYRKVRRLTEEIRIFEQRSDRQLEQYSEYKLVEHESEKLRLQCELFVARMEWEKFRFLWLLPWELIRKVWAVRWGMDPHGTDEELRQPRGVANVFRLLAIVVQLLPRTERDRYLEEFRAELGDIPPNRRLRHQLSLLRGVVVLRLRGSATNKAAGPAVRGTTSHRQDPM